MLKLKTALLVSVLVNDGTDYVEGTIFKSVEEIDILGKSEHMYILSMDNDHMVMSLSLSDVMFNLEEVYDKCMLYNEDLGKEVYFNKRTEEMVITEYNFNRNKK